MDFETISQYCAFLFVPYLVVVFFSSCFIQVYLKVRSSYTDIKLETRKEPPINIYLLDGLFVVVFFFLAAFVFCAYLELLFLLFPEVFEKKTG